MCFMLKINESCLNKYEALLRSEFCVLNTSFHSRCHILQNAYLHNFCFIQYGYEVKRQKEKTSLENVK